MTKKIKILIHDYGGFSFSFSLTKELARRGYEVYHIYSALSNKFDFIGGKSNLKIIKLGNGKSKRNNFFKRWFDENKYGLLASQKILEIKPDIVLSSNTPLDAQKKIFLACNKVGAKFIFWLSDINSIAATLVLQKKIPILGKLIGRHYQSVEKNILRKSEFVVPVSQDFESILRSWKINEKNIKVINDWAPLDDLSVKSKNNFFARKYGLQNKFCFLITGSLGFKHHPELIIKLAEHFKMNDKVRVVVASEGFVIDWLKKEKSRAGINNLILLPYQSKETISYMLASADVLFATLNDDAGIYSAPSRVLTYMCSKRAILFAGPETNLISRILISNKAGIVVNPKNSYDFIFKADELLKNKKLRDTLSRNARKYAEKTFDISEIANRFESLF